MKAADTPIRFKALLYKLKDWTIFRLPDSASKQLPSRGQVAVRGTIDDHEIHVIVEPDGNWGHWLRVTSEMQEVIGVKSGDSVEVVLTPVKQWPEPTLPSDVAEAFDKAPQKVKDKWRDITPMARWEWIRWVNATGNLDTRAVRIVKTISKLDGEHRRPCCFNRAACTEPYVAKNARLIGIE